MAITVKHKFVSAIPDAGDPTIVQPSNWNDTHDLVGTVSVANGGTGAATLTGYVKGSGTSNMTASSTIPNTDISGLGTASTKDAGVANGVATLDGSGTVPISQLPAAVLGALSYQGTWNASTNTPTLTSSVGTKGYYYVVNVAGSTNLNGITDWLIGDWAVYNGSAWQKVDNTDAVTSVNGYTGTVVLTNTDITGFGTMSTQNANSVAITGGTINGTSIGATTPNTGAFTYTSTNSTTSTTPVLSFNASNSNMASGATIANSYLQNMLQNKSGTAGASTNYVLSNDLGTDSTYYGEFGMNSSIYSSTTPIDFFSINNGVYFSSHDGDVTVGSGNGYKSYLAWGTAGQSAHVINASGAIGLNTNLGTTPALSGTTNFGTSGQVLTSGGNSSTPTWTTPTTGTVTSVSGTTGRITSTGGTTPVIDLASGVATAGTTGSSTLIPVVTIDTYGRVTSISTASNPQGTVTSVAALTLGTTGTDLSSTVATGTTTPVITLNVPTASATNRGALSAADWTTFNSKGSGTVTSVTGTSPVVSSGGATPAISMPAATGSVNGYLTSTDWTTFNSKGSGTVTSVAATVPTFLSVTGSPITSSGTLAISLSGTALPAINGGTGLTAVGTSGNVLTSNGSAWVSQAPTVATASYTRTSFTATVGQTTFSVTYTAPYIEVYQNGALLNATDYTATNGTSVVLTIGASTGDIIETIAYNATSLVSAAGSNTQVQYNNSGALGASSGFTFTGNDLNIPFGTSNSATSSAKIALALSMIA